MVAALLSGGALAALLYIGAVVSFHLLGVRPSRGASAALLSVLVYGPLSLGVWFFALKRRHASWSALGFRPVLGRGLALTLGAVLLMIPVLLLLLATEALVTSLIALVTGGYTNPQQQDIAPGGVLTFADFMWLFVTVAVIAPIAEELMFRGLVYRYLRGKTGVTVSALLSAALFAALHVKPILLPILFVVGLVLALVAERFDSIYPAIALHALNNGAALVLLYIGLQHTP